MSDRLRFIASVGLTTVAIATLAAVTVANPPDLEGFILILAFGALVVFAMAYSVPIGGGQVSLMPMTIGGAYLIGGKVVASWAAALGMLGHAYVRRWRVRHQPGTREPSGRLLIEATAFNVAMHALGVLGASWVFETAGGQVPLVELPWSTALVLLLAGVIYIALNHLFIAGYFAMRGRAVMASYLDSFWRVLLFEGGPLIFAPLVALIYTRLGPSYFALFALALSLSSLISHSLALTRQRLERRLRELSSLQAVGHTLSASLDVNAVLETIYEQVQKLMPAPSFYIALYDAELDEVSFPIVITESKRAKVQARRARRGLTEYVLQRGAPLLIPRDVPRRVAALGLEHIGRDAACWLGIPIMAGDEALGMIAVQSYDTPEAYDTSHMEILETIAAQAAIAIQNARLYERTDEALTRRVQELDSVLRTTQDGMLLLDVEWQVLAVNRALTDFLAIAQIDLPRHPVDAVRSDGESLLSLIQYTMEDLRADCEVLAAGQDEQVEAIVALGPSGIHVDRTLTPVRDNRGNISGWLLVFRDMTEELELERLRKDMTDMLVHDLRSPMSLVLASLAMITETHERGDHTQIERLVNIARRSSDRILTLIDDLLDIGRLERGQLPLTLENIPVDELFREMSARFMPVATSSRITFEVDCDEGLPSIRADRSLVTRVLSNLVDNAMKFTPDGGEVSLSAELNAEQDGHLCISVRDTGPGIPPEARPQIFEKFQQISGIRGRRRGTGLGLPFCKLAVDAHGGQIWVRSEVGKGSTFCVTLPLARGGAAEPMRGAA